MGKTGPDFYDDEAVFTTYASGRSRVDNPNDTLEKPVLLELAGDLAGKRILDLGCGDAAFGLEAIKRGCRSYLGLDGSRYMINEAQKTLSGTAGQVILANIEQWEYPQAAFDLVVSRLALHYVAEIEPVFAQVYRSLVAGGSFVFSVEHPVITSCDRAWQHGAGVRSDWIVDDYFDTGKRVTNWLGGQIIKYHRTVEDYFLALQKTGFRIESLRESRPQRHHFVSEATYLRRKRIPLFLFFSAKAN
jgi:SAM-dependent methyltransferase